MGNGNCCTRMEHAKDGPVTLSSNPIKASEECNLMDEDADDLMDMGIGSKCILS